jgi:hypothetical protein
MSETGNTAVNLSCSLTFTTTAVAGSSWFGQSSSRSGLAVGRYLVPDPAPGDTEFLQRVEAEALDRFPGLGATGGGS